MMTADRLQDELEGFHDETRGAVAMAAMAACLILFMISLVLWDAGHATRDKVDLQNAADSAAYSEAAVEARNMNMLAYTNIAKRTVVGLHNTYWGMWMAYTSWVAQRCAEICEIPCQWGCCLIDFCALSDCWSNMSLVFTETFGDWRAFTGPPYIGPMPWGDSGDVFGEELEDLDNYQNYLTDIAPWWGWTEQLLRGVRNGATMTSTWPPPPDRLTQYANVVDRFMRLIPNSSGLNNTTYTDELPVAIDHDSLYPSINQFLPSNVAWIANQVLDRIGINDVIGTMREVFYNMEACSPGMPGMSPMTPGSIAEVGANVALHRSRSENPPGNCTGGPESGHVLARGAAMAVSLCPISAILPQFSEHMGPAYLRGSESLFTGLSGSSTLPNSVRELQRRSNVVFAYKQSPKYQGTLRENFSFLGDEYYDRGQTNITNPSSSPGLQNPMLKASGQWALSSSEIVHTNKALTPGSSSWINLGGLTQGAHNTWMWHAGWTAKLRPLALHEEFRNRGSGPQSSFLNSMFHDVIPYLAGGASIMNIVSGNTDVQQMAWDFFYMEKATNAMNNETLDGAPQ